MSRRLFQVIMAVLGLCSSTDKRKHNFYYAVLPGASHTSSYAFQYAYNALLHLWKNEPGGDDTTSIKPVKM